MAELDLPEGPRELFSAVTPLLINYLGKDSFRLGGGTALAARWKHRHSTDIDLFADLTRYQMLVYDRANELQADLEHAIPDVQVASFERGTCRILLARGEVTIMTAPCVTFDPPSDDTVRGTPIRLETTAEILARKLALRMYQNGVFVPRDLYDLARARAQDPDALATALGTITPENRQELIDELRALPEGWIDHQRPRVLSPAHPEDVHNAVLLCRRLLEPSLDRTVTPLQQQRDLEIGL